MNRRTSLWRLLGVAAAVVAVTAPPATADVVHVRPAVKRWINRHRRYLHHHLPRRRHRK